MNCTHRRTRSGLLVGGVIAVLLAGLVSPSVAASNATEPGAAGWTSTFLPDPEELPDADVVMTGTDSMGGYSGHSYDQVITWSAGKATVHGAPTGYEGAWSSDQNGTIVVGAAWNRGRSRNSPFVLRGNRFQLLRVPAGYTSALATAVNSRGDVAGSASGPSGSVFVVWKSSDPMHPVVFDCCEPYTYVYDIDEDGTVLLDGTSGSYLWRDGVLRTLAVPAGFDYIAPRAINNGRVVGTAFPYDAADARGILWRSPDKPTILPGSASAVDINSAGLILGRTPVPFSGDGPLAVWSETTLISELPEPPGYPYLEANVIGDDATVVGYASEQFNDKGPGRPVIWRYQRQQG